MDSIGWSNKVRLKYRISQLNTLSWRLEDEQEGYVSHPVYFFESELFCWLRKVFCDGCLWSWFLQSLVYGGEYMEQVEFFA